MNGLYDAVLLFNRFKISSPDAPRVGRMASVFMFTKACWIRAEDTWTGIGKVEAIGLRKDKAMLKSLLACLLTCYG